MNEVKRYKLLQSVCYDDGAFVIPAGQVMVTASAHDDVVQALRAENARLREALERIAKPALGGKLQQQIARAALTPQGKGGGNDSSVIVMGPNDAMTEGKGGGE